MQKLTQQQLDDLTNEMNEYMADKKRFPPAKIDELAALGAKRCNKCHRVKHLGEFAKNASRRDGLMGQCKQCHCAGKADYYRRNTDKVLEYARDYYEQNKEYYSEYHHTKRTTDEIFRLREQLRQGYKRAVAAGNDAEWITAEQLLTWWDAKGIPALTCYLTGEELTPQNRSVDHVLSIGNGGGHTVDNLMPCTLDANRRKANLEPDEAKQRLTNDNPRR